MSGSSVEALFPYPQDLVIATKAGLTRSGPEKWAPVGRPEYLRQQLEMSLRRLRLERIDLYQLHRFDARVPVEETLGAMQDFQREGKVRHIGLSEVSVAEIEQARRIVEFVSVQNRYNISDREHEPVLEYCEKHRLAFIPWFPVAAGNWRVRAVRWTRWHGVTGSPSLSFRFAWLLHRSQVMLPIPGGPRR